MAFLDDAAWSLLFMEARTFGAWLDRAVDDAVLRRLYELARLGPTGANSQPMRLVFVRSPAGKERLRPTLDAGIVEKALTAPVSAIVAYDSRFFDKLPKLAPHLPDMGKRIEAMDPEMRQRMAVLSCTLQCGYLIVAARGLGLDCGPMRGFDAARVDAEFFPDGRCKSVLLVNLGYGDRAKLHPRAPRLEFDETCLIT